jgi:hypothetical protein
MAQGAAYDVADNGCEPGSGTNLLQNFLDPGIFRQQSSIHCNILRRALLKENQGVADVVGVIDGGGDLFDHFLLGSDTNTWRCFDSANRHYSLLSCLGTPTFSNNAQRVGAVGCAIRAMRSDVHS